MKLRPYQSAALEQALQHNGFALFMEQRTGKTLVSAEIIRRRRPQRLLIICPKIAIETIWEPVAKRYLAINPQAQVQIINYESVWSNRKKLKRWKPNMVVADESHRIKNRKSKQSKVIRSLANGNKKWPGAEYRLALTGTPIGQGIEDAWAEFDFIDRSVFGKWDDFKAMYLRMGGYFNKEIIGTRNLTRFYRKFHSRMFRVELEEVKKKATKITERIVSFDLKASSSHYADMHQKFMVDLKAKRITAPRVITQLMKLHQLSGGFIIDENKQVHRIGDEKVEHCVALALKLHRSGQHPKIVVVVKFVWEMDRLRRVFEALGLSVTVISGKNHFSGFHTDIAIIQIQSGVAIDLAEAQCLIFHSFHHSYLDYEQSKFRIRSYDSDVADYYFLLARGTIDFDIYHAVRNKRGVASYVLDIYRRK